MYIYIFVVYKHIHTHPGCSSQGPFRRVEPGDSPKVSFSSFVSVDRRVLHGEKLWENGWNLTEKGDDDDDIDYELIKGSLWETMGLLWGYYGMMMMVMMMMIL